MTLPSPARRRTAALFVAATLALVTGCGSDGGDAEAPSGSSTPQTATTDEAGTTSEATDGGVPSGDEELAVVGTTVGSADQPIMALPVPGSDGAELWVAERAGVVRRFAVADDGTLEATGDPVLDISDETTTEAERGLLSMAFSPDGSELFVSSTDVDGNSRIDAYEVAGDGLDASSKRAVYAIDQPYPNHNGGHLLFGPDDQLWFGLGDGGASDDPENRAQDPGTELGKVIRIDPASGEAEIVISGVRNPWRFAFDDDGALWIGDVGQNALEEVDHLPADEIDGANLGWSGFEGSEPYLDGDGRRPDDAIAPVFEYGRDGGNCSITGGFPYHGEAIPALQGAFLFADYCAGAVRAIFLDGDGAFEREVDLGIDVENPISFAIDGDGEPLVLSQAGDIVRIVPAS